MAVAKLFPGSSAAFLREHIRRGAVLGSVLATLGVLVTAGSAAHAQVSADAVSGSLAIVAASVFYALSLVLLRRQAQAADPLEVALFTSVSLSALLLLGAPWLAELPSVAQLPAIGASAVLGSISAMAIAWAYARAEAQVLAPVEYTAFVWAALLGWWVFGERVSPGTSAGAALIIAGCIVAVRGAPVPVPRTEAAA